MLWCDTGTALVVYHIDGAVSSNKSVFFRTPQKTMILWLGRRRAQLRYVSRTLGYPVVAT